ncbi:MAG: MFS transporter [Halobacteriales archaeon]
MDRNDRAITTFMMLGHGMFHTYELVIPIFVGIWLEVFSTTPAILGVVVGASYGLIGIGALPAGILSDRFSAKRLVTVCMLGMGGGFLVVGVAPNLIGLSLGLLIWGVAASIYHPAGLSLISRGANARGMAFAYHGAAGNLSVAVGPLLGALLLMVFPWRTVALLLVVPAIVAVAVTGRLQFDETAAADPEPPSAGGPNASGTIPGFVSNSRVLFASGFVFVFVIGNLYGLYYRGAFTFLPKILAELPLFEPVAVAGQAFDPSQYVYSGLLVLGGVGQYVGGKLVEQYRAEHVLITEIQGESLALQRGDESGMTFDKPQDRAHP